MKIRLSNFTIVLLIPLFLGCMKTPSFAADEDDIIKVKNNMLTFKDKSYSCAIGKGGIKVDKKEGDGSTPFGKFFLRKIWFRADKINLQTTNIKLPIDIIHPDDGWCDDSNDSKNYNKHVKLPYNGSHEEMYRKDNLYDLVTEIGYNDDPAIPNKGSAIFLHICREGYLPTAGCIALKKEDILDIIYNINEKTLISIE